jgi:hypothetical protein
MSDFISDLRGDLVDAADRHRRRGRARRTRDVLPRLWRPVGTAATAIAIALAVLVGARTLSPPPPEARPEVAVRVQLGGQPQDAVLAEGSLWVTDFAGRVIQVHPTDGDVIARIRVTGHPLAIAAGDGAVWAVSPGTGGAADQSVLTRIDPRTARVIDRIPVRGYVDSVAVGAGGVWVIDKRAGAVDRIDPVSHERTAHRKLARAATLAAAPGASVWVSDDEGRLLSLDGTTQKTRLRGIAVGHGPADNSLVADAEGAWIVGRGDGTLLRVGAAGGIASHVSVKRALGPIAVGDHTVWLVSGDPDHRGATYRLASVDPEALTVTSTFDLGSSQPKALVAVGDDVWVVATDGTAQLVKRG